MRASGYVDERNGITLSDVTESAEGEKQAGIGAPHSVIDVARWSADDCRAYLRYVDRRNEGRETHTPPGVSALITRVRERLAGLQLTELWPLDPRD